MKNLHKIANNLFLNKQYYLAIEVYNYLLNKQYKSSIIYSNISACYLYIKDYKNALNYALQSIQINLNNSIAWGRVGYSYKGLKMFSESLYAFELAHKFNKNNDNYLKELIFLHDRFNKKINISNVFNLLLNNNTLFNKIKENKDNIINNNNINEIINEILNKL